MQISRLFQIVYILMNKKQVTAHDLAARLEVSRRTIIRDIDTLAEAGIPIYTTRGRYGGIFLQDNFVLNKAIISEEEQNQILFSLQSMFATELISTDSLLGKLQSLFSGTNKDWIDVDFSRWGHSEEDNEKFEMLKNAILSERMVSFDYVSPYGELKGHEVCPLTLAFKSKSWYVKTFCPAENDYRVYKFNRISNIAVLDTTFDGASYTPPPMHTVEEKHTDELHAIKVNISPYARYRMYDEFATGDFMKNDDGSFTIYMPDARWVYDYLLSYGTSIEVLEPQKLRDEMRGHITKIKNMYEG